MPRLMENKEEDGATTHRFGTLADGELVDGVVLEGSSAVDESALTGVYRDQ